MSWISSSCSIIQETVISVLGLGMCKGWMAMDGRVLDSDHSSHQPTFQELIKQPHTSTEKWCCAKIVKLSHEILQFRISVKPKNQQSSIVPPSYHPTKHVRSKVQMCWVLMWSLSMRRRTEQTANGFIMFYLCPMLISCDPTTRYASKVSENLHVFH